MPTVIPYGDLLAGGVSRHFAMYIRTYFLYIFRSSFVPILFPFVGWCTLSCVVLCAQKERVLMRKPPPLHQSIPWLGGQHTICNAPRTAGYFRWTCYLCESSSVRWFSQRETLSSNVCACCSRVWYMHSIHTINSLCGTHRFQQREGFISCGRGHCFRGRVRVGVYERDTKLRRFCCGRMYHKGLFIV